jgi:hypothetical protein
MAASGDVFPGQPRSRSIGDVVLNNGANLQFWLLSMVMSDSTPVNVGAPGQCIVAI